MLTVNDMPDVVEIERKKRNTRSRNMKEEKSIRQR